MEEFAEEIDVLAAIYGDDFAVDEFARYSIRISMHTSEQLASQSQPEESDIESNTIRLFFWASELYPLESPPCYRIELPSSMEWIDKKSSKSAFDQELHAIWKQSNGQPIIHDWIEFIRDHGNTYISTSSQSQSQQQQQQQDKTSSQPNTPILPNIYTGQPLTDRKSKFIPFITSITSVSQIPHLISHIQNLHPSSTHVMVAYRIGGLENRDDDGETGAGDRMLYLLQKMGLENVFACVVRYYGGIKLGGDRFRDITGCLKDLIDDVGVDTFKK